MDQRCLFFFLLLLLFKFCYFKDRFKNITDHPTTLLVTSKDLANIQNMRSTREGKPGPQKLCH